MPSTTDLAGPAQSPDAVSAPLRAPIGEFARLFQAQATPFNQTFSYYAAAPFAADDQREFIDEPILALPPRVLAGLGQVVLLFVPFIERPADPAATTRSGKRLVSKLPPPEATESFVTTTAPPPANRLPVVYLPAAAPGLAHTLVFGVQDVDSSDYHYNFFHSLSMLVFLTQPDSVLAAYRNVLREELKSRAHGEVDDASWKAKLDLLKKESGVRGESKLFLEYARQSFVDTMTLFLHGICCDIDVEPGPRQIASRYLRKRLQLLQIEYPQPVGYAVFPEELKN